MTSKTIIRIAELIAAFFFFVLPPIFAKTNDVYTVSANYNYLSMFLFALYTCWFFLSADVHGKTGIHLCKKVLNAVLCFLFLTILSCLFQSASKFAFQSPKMVIEGTQILSFWFFVNNVLGALVFASFEEILYRIFLPSRLQYFKVPEWAADALALALFAFAHKALGVWGMANALVCGAALLRCYKKTGSVCAICIVHGAYNLIGRALVLLL